MAPILVIVVVVVVVPVVIVVVIVVVVVVATVVVVVAVVVVTVVIRVANYRYNFFIAIVDKIFKIIAILSVIGDNFSKVRNTIA